MSAIEQRLAELGVTLPDAPAPAANYVPYVIHGNMLIVSGQISNGPDGFINGKLGDDMDTDPRSGGSGTGSRDLMQELRA
ncbi:MAG: RidA family protein, partial [Paracoccaceae bacterium]|nr:RidA family protein [Paracoccaceae bacterium]